MSYQDMFQRYGHPSEDAEVGFRAYLRRPDQLKEAKEILWQDHQAESAINGMETLIENLKDFRKALAARYAELETMPYKLRLELERRPMYDGHKIYYIRLVKTFSDGSEVVELSETYPGKERRKAIERFDQLCKERPGIEIVKDIAKRQWER